jgi:hypothetical protein
MEREERIAHASKETRLRIASRDSGDLARRAKPNFLPEVPQSQRR